jgi:hypothetical protein
MILFTDRFPLCDIHTMPGPMWDGVVADQWEGPGVLRRTQWFVKMGAVHDPWTASPIFWVGQPFHLSDQIGGWAGEVLEAIGCTGWCDEDRQRIYIRGNLPSWLTIRIDEKVG